MKPKTCKGCMHFAPLFLKCEYNLTRTRGRDPVLGVAVEELVGTAVSARDRRRPGQDCGPDAKLRRTNWEDMRADWKFLLPASLVMLVVTIAAAFLFAKTIEWIFI